VSRLCLYYRTEPERDRWLPGDRFVRPIMRRLLRGRGRIGGVEKVFANLCLGLDRLQVSYRLNLPFEYLRHDDRIGVLGRGRYALQGYDRKIPIVAGIGLMTHPSEWPTLCQDFPVKAHLQHSEWANNIYRRYFGDRCHVWPAGVDTEAWRPVAGKKDLDFLVYNKVLWEQPRNEIELIRPIRNALKRRNLTFAELKYGSYTEFEYQRLLARAKAMIFLCEHESQGLAYQECLSCDIPILAWDQGWWLDPHRFQWGTPQIPATSVPYFDSRCGERFARIEEFEGRLDRFLERLHLRAYRPRDYVVENLSLEQCSQRFLGFFDLPAGED